MSTPLSLSSPSKGIYVLSESPSIKVDGNCYKKVPGFFGAETHNVSSINSEHLNCEICEGNLKTVDINNIITINKYRQCVIINLSNQQVSQINIYNGKTTTSHKIKNNLDSLVLNYNESKTYSFSNSNKLIYLEVGLLTYKVEYIEDSNNKYLCFSEDPFRERCNNKVGVIYDSFKNSNFQKISITLYKNSSNEKKYTFHIGANLESSLKEVETFFGNIYESSLVDIKLKLNSLNNNLMFWKPFGSEITESQIAVSTQNYSLIDNHIIVNLSDQDFDGVIDSSDPYPYGGNHSSKVLFKSNDANLKDFTFGDSMRFETNSSLKGSYVIENFSSVSNCFDGLSSEINSDYSSGLNNLYSRVYFDVFSNLINLEVWDPCSLSAPPEAKLSLIKTSINLNSESYFSNNENVTDQDGPYTPDGGAYELLLTPKTPIPSNPTPGPSGKYFISLASHNSKPVYKNTINDYCIIWDSATSHWRLSIDLDFSSSELITFGSLDRPSSVELSESVSNNYYCIFSFGLNNAPTYSNGNGYYIFKHSLGSWFLTDIRYGISSSSTHTSELTIC